MDLVVTERKVILHLGKTAVRRRWRVPGDSRIKGGFYFTDHTHLKVEGQLSVTGLQAVYVVVFHSLCRFRGHVCILGLSLLNIKFSSHLCIYDNLYSSLPLVIFSINLHRSLHF